MFVIRHRIFSERGNIGAPFGQLWSGGNGQFYARIDRFDHSNQHITCRKRRFIIADADVARIGFRANYRYSECGVFPAEMVVLGQSLTH